LTPVKTLTKETLEEPSMSLVQVGILNLGRLGSRVIGLLSVQSLIGRIFMLKITAIKLMVS